MPAPPYRLQNEEVGLFQAPPGGLRVPDSDRWEYRMRLTHATGSGHPHSAMLTSLIESLVVLLSGRWPRWPLWLSHIHLLPRGDPAPRDRHHQHGGAARGGLLSTGWLRCLGRPSLPRPTAPSPRPRRSRGLEGTRPGAEALGLLVRVVEGFFTTVTSTAAAAAVVVVDQGGCRRVHGRAAGLGQRVLARVHIHEHKIGQA